MEYSILSNNLKMPMAGFGVFQVTDKKECKQSVLNAIRTGYRLIDTAAVYGNEDAVGDAVREAIGEGLCTRDELFITSKLWVQDMASYDMAKAGIEASLEKSGLEYFDLYLLHQAMRDYFSAWRALEDAYDAGKLKAIGVSNFYAHVLANFCETVRIRPMVNQVELHPYFAQPAALETMKYYKVQPEAWAPLAAEDISRMKIRCYRELPAPMKKRLPRLFCAGTFSVVLRLSPNPRTRSVLMRILPSGISH